MVVLFVIILLLFYFGFYVIGSIALLAVASIYLICISLFYIVSSTFYYVMGKEAGFDLPWIAFFPFGKNYISFTIPHREFKLGAFSTLNRRLVFWIWFAAEILVYLLCTGGFLYIFLEMEHIAKYFMEYTPSMLTDDLPKIIIAIVFAAFLLTYYIIRSVIHWRKNYDLLKTYGYNKAAVIVPTLNLLCPLVMMIFPLALAGRLPEYGADGYYPLEEEY